VSDWYRRALQSYFLQTGKTQKEIAAELGATQPTVARWMSGRSVVSLAYREKIEKLCGQPAAPQCPLDQSGHCPVFNNNEIDFLAGELWRIWSRLDHAAKVQIVAAARKKLKST